MKALMLLSLLAVSQASVIVPPYATYGTLGLPYAHSYLPYAAPVTVAAAAPAIHPVAAAPIFPVASQFNSGDEFGNFNFGYTNINSAKQEAGNSLTGVVGSYSYVDANNVVQHVNYVADALGFRVAGTNLPVAPVADLKEPVFDLVGPAPVEDTDDVKKAKEEFLKAFQEAEAASGEAPESSSRRKRSLVAPVAIGTHLTYASGLPVAVGAPLTYASGLPVAYSSAALPAPWAYPAGLPLAYSAASTPVVYAAPAAPTAEAVLTKIKLNPGHAEAYRVD